MFCWGKKKVIYLRWRDVYQQTVSWEMNLYEILEALSGFKNYILNSVMVQPYIRSLFFLGGITGP